jgi:hypothetical protein
MKIDEGFFEPQVEFAHAEVALSMEQEHRTNFPSWTLNLIAGVAAVATLLISEVDATDAFLRRDVSFATEWRHDALRVEREQLLQSMRDGLVLPDLLDLLPLAEQAVAAAKHRADPSEDRVERLALFIVG